MANEYKQGIDRVAVDESFPYPIKLTYDERNDLLDVSILKLPSELGLTSATLTNSDFILALEIRDGDSRRIGHGHLAMHPNRGHGHPSASGKFHLSGLSRNFPPYWQNFSKEQTYSYPVQEVLWGSRSLTRMYRDSGKYPHVYFRVRATYRHKNSPNYTTTKVYSNIVFIQIR